METRNTMVIRSALGVMLVDRDTGAVLRVDGHHILRLILKIDVDEFRMWEQRELGELAGKRNLIELEEIGAWFIDGDYVSPCSDYRIALLEARPAITRMMGALPAGALFGVHLARCDSPEHNHQEATPPTATKH